MMFRRDGRASVHRILCLDSGILIIVVVVVVVFVITLLINSGTAAAAKHNRTTGASAASAATPVRLPKLTASTWAVAASTPFGTAKNVHHGSASADLTSLPPYVHWVCFHQTTTTTTSTQHAHQHLTKEKMDCCHQIYEIMLEHASALCWKKVDLIHPKCNGQMFPNDRRDFLQHCAEQLVSIAPDDGSIPIIQQQAQKDASHRDFVPRFSLLEVPPATSTILFEEQIWRQYLWLSSGSDHEKHGTGQWHLAVRSPLRMAIDPNTGLAEFGPEDNVNSTVQTFGTAFVTTLMAGANDDDEEDDGSVRLLTHRISTNLVFYNHATDQDDYVGSWSMVLRIMLFVPVGLQLPTAKLFGPCQTSSACGATRSCTVSLAPASQTLVSDVDQQEVIPILIHAQGSSKTSSKSSEILDLPSSSSECQLGWTTRLLIDDPDDDDTLLLASPVIQDGMLVIHFTVDGKTTSTPYQWRMNETFPAPLRLTKRDNENYGSIKRTTKTTRDEL